MAAVTNMEPAGRLRSGFGIGACTWIFGDRSLADIAQRLSALAFDGVELLGDLSRCDPKQAARILEGEGLTVYSLTPENVDLAHPDEGVRTRAIDYYSALLDFAAAAGAPLVACHGYVGRVRALKSAPEERGWLAEGVHKIGQRAAVLGLSLVMEALNRYESHLLNTAAEALSFVEGLELDNVGILLDAYHMNIEEAEPVAALRRTGDRLWLYHAADSNRQGIGRGHTDFNAQLQALKEIGYRGPIIMECVAPGPDPFVALKDERSQSWLECYLRESREWLLGTVAQAGSPSLWELERSS